MEYKKVIITKSRAEDPTISICARINKRLLPSQCYLMKLYNSTIVLSSIFGQENTQNIMHCSVVFSPVYKSKNGLRAQNKIVDKMKKLTCLSAIHLNFKRRPFDWNKFFNRTDKNLGGDLNGFVCVVFVICAL